MVETEPRGSKRFSWPRVTVLVVTFLSLCQCGPRSDNAPSASQSPDPGAETQRMVERLQRLASRDALLSNPFESDVRAETLAQQPRPDSLKARIEADVSLAREWLQAGQPQNAVDLLKSVLDDLEGVANRDAVAVQLNHLLGIAYMRLGEQENCLDHHRAQSCLVPIKADAQHHLRSGSEQARDVYGALLQKNPGDLSAKWLYNLAAMTLGEYPEGVPVEWRIAPEIFESEGHVPEFSDVAMGTGTDVTSLAGGVVMEDLDNDGHLDLVVSSWGARDPIRFLHNTGNGRFDDRTKSAGLSGIHGGLNLIHGDYDNDGFADIFVLRGAWLGGQGHHPNSLLRNRGDGTFEDVTESAGLLSFHPTQTAAWADFDRDGFLDLFIGNESTRSEAHPSELYRNQGDGTFTDVAQVSGLAVSAFVKGVAWGDIDNDGWPDLYVSTLGGANLLFHNQGEPNGTGWSFAEIGQAAGVTEPVLGFPTWFWDFDNDGLQDIFAASYDPSYRMPVAALTASDYLQLEPGSLMPRLYRNRGDGTFEDVTRQTRLDRSLMAMGCNFGDLDSDGFLDFYIGTGTPDFEALAPNRMFRNQEGRVFEDVTTAGGFGHIQKGHGVAFGDWDHDGDQDVYAVMGGAFFGDVFPNAFFENPGHGNHWISLRLEGVQSNRSAIGARIRVKTRTASGTRVIHSTVSTGGSFGSSSLRREIGLASAEGIESIDVTWPSGHTQHFSDVAMDRAYGLWEDATTLSSIPAR